jgi:hypothetical protein
VRLGIGKAMRRINILHMGDDEVGKCLRREVVDVATLGSRLQWAEG